MLHYPTRPQRVQKLNDLGIHSISLDSIVNDHNLRLVENMRAVAWNGLEVAFDRLEKVWPGLQRENDRPFHVLILGSGMIGKHAVEAATKLGNIERNARQIECNGSGIDCPKCWAQPHPKSPGYGSFVATDGCAR